MTATPLSTATPSPTWTATPVATATASPTPSAPVGEYFAEYFNGIGFDSQPVVSQVESAPLNYNWGTGSPASGVNADFFSARWTGTFDFGEGGPYTFTATADDGVRVYVDDGLVIDGWFIQNATTYTSTVSVAAGQHVVRVEYFENDQEAMINVNWAATCPVGQYRAEYFANQTLTAPAALIRCEAAPINYNWGSGSPAANIPVDGFSARWTGTFTFAAQNYTFTARSDDGIRVWVDGVLIIDQWADRSPTTTNAKLPMTAGEHLIIVEYYENTGNALAQLTWK